MPQLHAAEKDLHKNVRRAKRNRTATVGIEVAIRTFRKALAGTDRAAAETAYRKVVKLADKATGRGILPKNRVARMKSRFAVQLKKSSSK